MQQIKQEQHVKLQLNNRKGAQKSTIEANNKQKHSS
jgi:hypothetical protein